jgi:hypothetical protein
MRKLKAILVASVVASSLLAAAGTAWASTDLGLRGTAWTNFELTTDGPIGVSWESFGL